MRQEIAMFALTELSRSTQRTVCMLVSVVIVAVGFSLWAFAAQPPLHDSYSVTVTQLQ
jgi:hypothetical protein